MWYIGTNTVRRIKPPNPHTTYRNNSSTRTGDDSARGKVKRHCGKSHRPLTLPVLTPTQPFPFNLDKLDYQNGYSPSPHRTTTATNHSLLTFSFPWVLITPPSTWLRFLPQFSKARPDLWRFTCVFFQWARGNYGGSSHNSCTMYDMKSRPWDFNVTVSVSRIIVGRHLLDW